MPETEVLSIFPTPVWKVDFEPEIHESLNALILRNLDEMAVERPPARPGATLQTNNNLHTFDEFVPLTECINDASGAALEYLRIDYSNFEITGCWVNINPVGSSHPAHTHPNNYLSGVYYVQTMDGADKILLGDPRPQASVVRPPTTEQTPFSGNEVSLEVIEGRMLIFPAWLNHSVPPNQGNRDRISVSFNIMFSGYTETMSKPAWPPSLPLQSRSKG